MKTFSIERVRVEHQVFRFEVEAENEEDAMVQAEMFMDESEFDWDDHEVVHADEWFNDITEQK